MSKREREEKEEEEEELLRLREIGAIGQGRRDGWGGALTMGAEIHPGRRFGSTLIGESGSWRWGQGGVSVRTVWSDGKGVPM